MDMKQHIGKRCKLHIKIDSADLFYTAREILAVDSTHVTFVDKYNKKYTFRKQDVVECVED